MKNILKIILLLVIMGEISCKKYLDVKPDAQLVVPTTLNDLQGLLDDALKMNQSGSPSVTESSSDDYFLADNVYNSLSTTQQEIYTWRLKKYNYPNDWSLCYIPVYNANLCLERLAEIKEIPANEKEWDNIKGSALFFRSYSFLNLCWEYSKAYDKQSAENDPGIVLRTTTDFNIPSKRASVEDSYLKVLKDTKEAAQLLPDNPVHVMRPSKAAAFALLARAYLSMRQYDSCFKYSDLCLKIKDHLVDLNGDPDLNDDISGLVPFKPYNKEVIFYYEMNRNIGLHMYYYGHIDSTLYNSYDSNDLRREVFLMPDNGYGIFKGSYASSPNVLFTGLATDEVLLMRAECSARIGDLTDAMNDLNHLLEKRWRNGTFIPLKVTDQADAIQKIVSERRKELLLRGLRWMDVKRLNKEAANISFKRIIAGAAFNLMPNDNGWALPLPDDIIKLTGMPQN